MSAIRLVICDIAGTIIKDCGEVLSAFALALRQNGISAAETDLLEWKGASKREVIRHFVERQPGNSDVPPSQQVERTYADFRRLLKAEYEKRGVIPIEGARQTFRWLLDRNISIATTTGFDREIRDVILRNAGWEQLFKVNVCSSDVSLGRPAPYMIFCAMEAAQVTSVVEVVNVGDTPLDLQAGSNAGVKGVIGVLTGTHNEARLRREEHTHIISSIAELPSVLTADFGVA